MEIGHVFQLGGNTQKPWGLQVLDENGSLVTVTMGSYGIGVTRIMAIIAEGHHDEKGLIWPSAVSPYDVHVDRRPEKTSCIASCQKSLLKSSSQAGMDVLFDDRPKVSPGVKFADAEVIGVPQIVIVGRGAQDGKAELWDRASPVSAVKSR
jgi:prolyl-tRNA synthetase